MASNLFVGRHIVRIKQVDSSNNLARELVRDKMPIEGTLVIAETQTQGRGQRSNSWLSEPGLNLTCSYILRPVFMSAPDQFFLSAAVALSVFETLSTFLPNKEIKIKWPNDVLVDKKKIAGILIENTLRKTNLETSIVGIGINVNQTEFDASLNATSVLAETGLQTDLNQLILVLNEKLEKNYLRLRGMNKAVVVQEFNQELFGIGEILKLTLNGEEEYVRVIGTALTGELELEHEDQRKTFHQHHEIDWNLKP